MCESWMCLPDFLQSGIWPTIYWKVGTWNGCGGFSMMPNSLYYSICTDLSHERAGAATGIMITFFSVSGIVSPALTGRLTDVFGGFGAAFGALVFFVVTAVLGMLLFAHPDSRGS